jgi:hypothetical protein
MNTLRIALLLGASIAIGACQTVEFETPPSMPLNTCDPVWVGDWRIENLRADQEVVAGQEQFLRVDANCKNWVMVEIRPGQGEELEIEVNDLTTEQEIGFAKSEKYQLLAARDLPDPDEKEAKVDKPEGWLLLSYTLAEKKLVLREADLKTAGRLVIDDRTPGWVEKHDRNSDGSEGAFSKNFWVFLFGTPESTKALLDANELFIADAARLTPLTPPESTRLSAALAEAQRREEAEKAAEEAPVEAPPPSTEETPATPPGTP